MTKYSCEKIIPDDGLKRAYYINLSNFHENKRLYFKMIMNNGRFTNTKTMFFETERYYNILKNIDGLTAKIGYDSYSRIKTNFTITDFYTSETYYYCVEKYNNSYNYLYITPPTGEFRYSNTSSSIELCNIENWGISIGIWSLIGAGAFVLVAFILIIVLYQYKRAPKQKHIDTTFIEPIVINASPSTNASNQND